MTSSIPLNIDPREVHKFAKLAARWWDSEGECKPLHVINPLRLDFVADRTTLPGKQVLDVGCGGGIFSEGLAQRGAQVTGIDVSQAAIQVARLHLLESQLQVDYRITTVEQLAAEMPQSYDVITCMEMLEHVPDPASVVQACARLVKPGGQLFFSTINRNPKAYMLAIVGAEYILRLLPQGTHDYARFIKPSELDAWLRAAGLRLQEIKGMTYNPLTRQFNLSRTSDVNYFVHAVCDA